MNVRGALFTERLYLTKSADEHGQEQRKQNRDNRDDAKQFDKGYTDAGAPSFAQVHDYFDRTEAERSRRKILSKTFADAIEALRRVQCVRIYEQEVVSGEHIGQEILPPCRVCTREIGCELEVVCFPGHQAIHDEREGLVRAHRWRGEFDFRFEKIAEVRAGFRRIEQGHLKNLLQRAKGRRVVEPVADGVAAALGPRGEDDGAVRAGDVGGPFVPRDDNRAVVLIRVGVENFRDFSRKPVVAEPNAISRRATGRAMHVVAEVWSNKIIARNGVVGQVALEFCVRADVVGAIRLREIDVIEIDERIVKGGVKSAAGRWASRSADALLIGFPRNAGVLKFNDEMIGRCKVVRRGVTAIAGHAPVCSGLQPKILRQASKCSRDNEHVAGIGALRQEERC